jgi:hypothetical protein
MPKNRHEADDEEDRPRRKPKRDDDDEEDRPRRKPKRDDDDDDRPTSRRRNRDDDDEEQDRRSSRRRSRDDDDDDDEPRSRSRTKKKQVSVLGIISLIKGGMSLIASLIPCIGVIAIIPGALALGLGITGFVIAKKSKGRQSTGLPIAGMSVSAAAIVISTIWILLMGSFSKKLDDAAANAKQQQEKTAKSDNEPVARIPARDLYLAFENRQGHEQYVNKWIEVNGLVFSANNQDRFVMINASGRGAGEAAFIHCKFAQDSQTNLAAYRPGQAIVIRGTCKRKNFESVILENCVIVQR